MDHRLQATQPPTVNPTTVPSAFQSASLIDAPVLPSSTSAGEIPQTEPLYSTVLPRSQRQNAPQQVQEIHTPTPPQSHHQGTTSVNISPNRSMFHRNDPFTLDQNKPSNGNWNQIRCLIYTAEALTTIFVFF